MEQDGIKSASLNHDPTRGNEGYSDVQAEEGTAEMKVKSPYFRLGIEKSRPTIENMLASPTIASVGIKAEQR